MWPPFLYKLKLDSHKNRLQSQTNSLGSQGQLLKRTSLIEQIPFSEKPQPRKLVLEKLMSAFQEYRFLTNRSQLCVTIASIEAFQNTTTIWKVNVNQKTTPREVLRDYSFQRPCSETWENKLKIKLKMNRFHFVSCLEFSKNFEILYFYDVVGGILLNAKTLLFTLLWLFLGTV